MNRDMPPIEEAAEVLNTRHLRADMHARRQEAILAGRSLLNVEQMAMAMRDAECTGHDHGTSACPDRHCRSDTLPKYRKLAEAIRAAQLGEHA
jgi:hypothetical protein